MVQAGEGRTYCRTCAGMMRNCRQPASVSPILDAPPGEADLSGQCVPGLSGHVPAASPSLSAVRSVRTWT